MNEIQQALQEAHRERADARARHRSGAGSKRSSGWRAARSITVTKDSERVTMRGINQLLPIAFVILHVHGRHDGRPVAAAPSTVEEKSSRVMEVLLSAVSPIELLAGKILGQFGVSLIVLGHVYRASASRCWSRSRMFGLLNPWLIVYLVIFFVLSYLTYGALMVSVGAVVNDMREAQSLMMPLMLLLTFPFWVWFPISMSPNSRVQHGDQLRAACEFIRDAHPPDVDGAAAVVAGLAVDRRRRGRRRRGAVVRGEGVQDRPADVRQAARLRDAHPLGAAGITPTARAAPPQSPPASRRSPAA